MFKNFQNEIIIFGSKMCWVKIERVKNVPGQKCTGSKMCWVKNVPGQKWAGQKCAGSKMSGSKMRYNRKFQENQSNNIQGFFILLIERRRIITKKYQNKLEINFQD